MCGIVGALMCLYCRSGCQASVVASALAFHPPEPFYKLEYNERTGNYDLVLDAQLPNVDFKAVKAELIDTKNKTKVPLLRLLHPEAKYTILYSHGNATDCGAMFYIYALLASRLKVNVVGYDYTGYGASVQFGVRPTEKQTYVDIARVYDWCIESGIVTDPATQLILYGQSVGSGPSCFLASQDVQQSRGWCCWKGAGGSGRSGGTQRKLRPVAGLVLHSPISSGLRVLTESRTLACFDIFPNLQRVQDIEVPLFVLHGQDDEEVPMQHGITLLQSAPQEMRFVPWWVNNRGHNNILQGNETEYIRRVGSFLQHVDAFHARRLHTQEQQKLSHVPADGGDEGASAVALSPAELV